MSQLHVCVYPMQTAIQLHVKIETFDICNKLLTCLQLWIPGKVVYHCRSTCLPINGTNACCVVCLMSNHSLCTHSIAVQT